jgi:hypothetical protein
MSSIEFTNFHYTGNHVNGRNSGNHEEVIAWARENGLPIRDEDDQDIFFDRLECLPGTHSMKMNGATLRYTVRVLKSDGGNSFGYTSRRLLTAVSNDA